MGYSLNMPYETALNYIMSKVNVPSYLPKDVSYNGMIKNPLNMVKDAYKKEQPKIMSKPKYSLKF